MCCACPSAVVTPPAGLFLLERLKPHLDMEASQALARLAPLTTGSSSSGAHHRDKRSTRQQRAAWVRARLAVTRARLKQQLVMAELLVLSEGAVVMQDSHVVLMKGTIQVRGCCCHAAAAGSMSRLLAAWLCSRRACSTGWRVWGVQPSCCCCQHVDAACCGAVVKSRARMWGQQGCSGCYRCTAPPFFDGICASPPCLLKSEAGAGQNHFLTCASSPVATLIASLTP